MRYIAALAIMCLFCGTAYARRDAKVLVYSNISGGIGNPFAFMASGSCLFSKRHEVSVGYQFYSRRARGVPSDYVNSSILGDNNSHPEEDFKGMNISYGYVVYPRHKAREIRYVLRAGVTVGQQLSPYNYTRSNSQMLFGGNYSFETRRSVTAAFVVHPTFDYTPRRAFGFSLGLYGIASNDFSGGGASIGFLLGKAGNRTKREARTERKQQ